jgi:hypothetical protein
MLNETAMLVSLSIGQPKQQRVDKKATDDVLLANSAARDSARVVKTLFNAKMYDPIKKLINEIRSYHYDHTLPWAGGSQILSNEGFMEYTTEMRKYRSRFEKLADKFAEEYTLQLLKAEEDLGALYDPSDYPSVRNVRSRFRLDISFLPVPTANDFRVEGIDEAEKVLIQAQIQSDTSAAMTGAMDEAYQRLRKAVGHMADKLSDSQAVFRDTLTGNVSELCDILPGLNLTGDPTLTDFIEQAKGLVTHAPDKLRKDNTLRQDVAKQAKQVTSLLDTYLGG